MIGGIHMKKILIIAIAIVSLAGGIVLAEALNANAKVGGEYSMDYLGQIDGVIETIALPNETTAVEVASAIVKNIVPADKMEAIHVMYDADIDAWIITFSPAAAPETIVLGEETNIVLSASDCRVLKIWGAE